MTIQTLDIEIGGDHADMGGVESLEVTSAYKQPCARFTMQVEGVGSFGLNDNITITVGLDNDTSEIFDGYIDSITTTRRPGIYEIIGRDILKRAIEHWIVTTDLENPWSRSNISAESLVGALLNEAGITAYSGDVSNFTFGVSNPAEFQLVSVWDSIERICNIIAWRCYAEAGTAYFKNLQPIPVGAATAYLRPGADGSITSAGYEKSTDNLRNKVVVFGRDGIYAEASAVSPYLPADFYKTAIVSSELIDSQQMADDAADYNLALYNRLTEVARLDVIGDADILARKTVSAQEWFTGISGKWFTYSCTHRVDENGFTTQLHLTR